MLEPVLESAPQAVTQLTYIFILTTMGKPFDDWVLATSLMASLFQLYQVRQPRASAGLSSED